MSRLRPRLGPMAPGPRPRPPPLRASGSPRNPVTRRRWALSPPPGPTSPGVGAAALGPGPPPPRRGAHAPGAGADAPDVGATRKSGRPQREGRRRNAARECVLPGRRGQSGESLRAAAAAGARSPSTWKRRWRSGSTAGDFSLDSLVKKTTMGLNACGTCLCLRRRSCKRVVSRWGLCDTVTW
jgi:hypothetical protein